MPVGIVNLLATSLAAAFQATPTNPGTTTSDVGVMMGLAGSITPIQGGRVFMLVSGDIDNSSLGNGAQVQIRYGTGTAPANGDALIGTTAGSLIKMLNPTLTLLVPGLNNFNVNGIASGLTLNATYWVDISLARITVGTARVRDISMSIFEV